MHQRMAATRKQLAEREAAIREVERKLRQAEQDLVWESSLQEVLTRHLTL